MGNLWYIDQEPSKELIPIKLREHYTCPLELSHDMLKGKWKPIILWRLRLGNTSLSQLKKDINGITEKMLLEQLKELIEYQFVDKKSYDTYPRKVEYFLTTHRGEEIVRALIIMQKLGIEFMVEHGMGDVLLEKGVDT